MFIYGPPGKKESDPIEVIVKCDSIESCIFLTVCLDIHTTCH